MASGGSGSSTSLCRGEYAESLAVIERARETLSEFNLDKLLPQICVLGDQSAGKSSVLEALTGVPFPFGKDTVTKTPAVVRVVPAEGDVLFRVRGGVVSENELKSHEDAREAIKNAQASILSSSGGGGESGGASWSKEAVTVEVLTDDIPPLVLVDLPGLVRTEGAGRDVVRSMVEERIEGDNVLILIVSVASQEAEMNEARDLARSKDREGVRSIQVFTKCDRAASDESEKESLLARFNDAQTEFVTGNELAPHFVSVRDDRGNLRGESDEYAALSFLRTEKDAPVGVASLRRRLTTLLNHRIRPAIPNVDKQLKDEAAKAGARLDTVGHEPRDRTEIITGAKRRLLAEILEWWTASSKDLESLAESIRLSRKDLFRDTTRGGGEAGGSGWLSPTEIRADSSTPEDADICEIMKRVRLRADIAPEFQGQDVVDYFIERSVDKWGDDTRALIDKLTSRLQERMLAVATSDGDPSPFRTEINMAIEDEMESVKKTVTRKIREHVESTRAFGTFNHYHSGTVIDEEAKADPTVAAALYAADGAIAASFPVRVFYVTDKKHPAVQKRPGREDERVNMTAGEWLFKADQPTVEAIQAAVREAIQAAFASARTSEKKKSHAEYQAGRVRSITIAAHKVKSKSFPDKVLEVTRDFVFKHFERWTEDLIDKEDLRRAAVEDKAITERRKRLEREIEAIKKVRHDLRRRFG